MKMTRAFVAALGVPLLMLVGGVGSGHAENGSTLVVTTSMLEEAVRALGEAAAGVDVVRLIPPGSCPGHFDLSPRAVPSLRTADAIVRHDYQGYLEEQIVDLGVADVAVIVAETEGSLLVPLNYARLVRRVADILAGLLPDQGEPLVSAANDESLRLVELESEIRDRPAPWRRAPVIVSFQQAGFSSWLDLDVVAEIGRPEDLTPREFERLMQLRPALVVGNLQEGLQSATTLAERMSVPLAVFSNFPGAVGYGTGYDELLLNNLERLDEAWASR
jgi:zinc transport system substrate-binding protein